MSFSIPSRPNSVPSIVMLALIAVCLIGALVSAHAQTAAAPAVPIVIPYGDWIGAVLVWARDLVVLLVGWTFARLAPAWLKSHLTAQDIAQTEQILGRAIDYAIAAVAGAEKGRQLDISTANAVVGAAERYVLNVAPGFAAQVGNLLRAKLLARLSAATVLAPGVTGSSVAAYLPLGTSPKG